MTRAEESRVEESAKPRPRRWKKRSILGLCVVLGALGILAWYYASDDDPPDDKDMELSLPPGSSTDEDNPARRFQVLAGKIERLTAAEAGVTPADYPSLGSALRAKREDADRWKEWPVEEATRYLEAHQALLNELETLVMAPASQWDFGVRFDIEYLVPHEPHQAAYDLLTIAGLQALNQGEPAVACESVARMISLGNITAERIPLAIGGALGSAWRRRAIEVGEEILKRSALTPEALEAFAAELLKRDPDDRWVIDSCKGEYLTGRNALRSLERYGDSGNELVTKSILGVSFFNENRSIGRYLALTREQVDAMENHRPVAADFYERWNPRDTLWKNWAGTMLLEILRVSPRIYDTTLGSHAEVRAFILRLGLLAHAGRNGGQLPARLEDLTPDVLPSLPTDPFSGESFGYDATAGHVHSVGPDRKDDGGAPGTRQFDARRSKSGNDDPTMMVMPKPGPVPAP